MQNMRFRRFCILVCLLTLLAFSLLSPLFILYSGNEESGEEIEEFPAIKRERMQFAPSELLLMRKHLAKYIKDKTAKLDKKKIETELRKIPEMVKLLDEIGVSRIIVKIHTERRYSS